MINFNPTKEQIMAASCPIQNRYIRIELLNYQFITIDYVEGRCIGGNISINADSDIRRTGNINLIVDNSSFRVVPGSSIWLDKYLRIWVGTQTNLRSMVDWVNCGIYIIDAPSYFYDHTNNTLSLSLLDLMAKMTGLRNGYLEGIPVVFKAGEDIQNAIESVLKLAGFNQYQLATPPYPGVIPFDLEFGQGATAYELLKGLVDLYPGYEMFFDIDGTFIYQKIPDGTNTQIFLDDALWDNVVIAENISVDFQNIKNSIEVFGRSHDPAYFSANTSVSGNTITLNIEEVKEYSNGVIYGFTLTDNTGYRDMQLKINNLNALPITLDDGRTPAIIEPESGEVYYCVQYNENGYWNWLGHLQAYALVEDKNPKSPFYVNGSVGKIRLPLFGGDYDNIFSDDLARQRGEYELYLHSRLNDSIQLTCIPIYWLDVNMPVVYTVKQSSKKSVFLTKAINLGLGANETMTISMMKLYVDYPRPVPPKPPVIPVKCKLYWNVNNNCNVKWNDDQSDYIVWQ